MQLDLVGKTALILGASAGIGAATVRLLAELGAQVVLASRNIQATEALAAEIQARGGSALAVRADVERQADVEAAVGAALETYGDLDIAVNNAGVQGPARPVSEQSEDDFGRILRINLKGVWLAMRAEIPGRGVRHE